MNRSTLLTQPTLASAKFCTMSDIAFCDRIVAVSENTRISPDVASTGALCAASFLIRYHRRTNRSPTWAHARTISAVPTVEQTEATTIANLSRGKYDWNVC